jgi:SEC-C motif domain protein
MNQKNKSELCPCGSMKETASCCERFFDSKALPSTPEELMRSRYTAYVRKNVPYLEKTWHHSTSPNLSSDDLGASTYIKLAILNSALSKCKKKGTTEFKAYYISFDVLYCLHEKSNFSLEEDGWKYIDGQIFNTEKERTVSRSEACPCGSGIKYKRCHGKPKSKILG